MTSHGGFSGTSSGITLHCVSSPRLHAVEVFHSCVLNDQSPFDATVQARRTRRSTSCIPTLLHAPFWCASEGKKVICLFLLVFMLRYALYPRLCLPRGDYTCRLLRLLSRLCFRRQPFYPRWRLLRHLCVMRQAAADSELEFSKGAHSRRGLTCFRISTALGPLLAA